MKTQERRTRGRGFSYHDSRLMQSLILALALTGCIGPRVNHAVEEKLPNAEAILDKYVEATGGMDTYEKIHNRVTRGTFDIVQMGIKSTLTIYHAKPNRLYSLVEMEGLGKTESGINGDVAWEMSLMTGPRIKVDQERADVLRDGTFDKFAYWRKVYEKAEYAGTELVDGQPCYKVVMTPRTGNPQTLYFDIKSNLIVKVDASIEHQMGTIPIESFLDDYRDVDGCLIPHRTKIMVMGQERIITTEIIEHNVEMPDDIFDLPEEVQALVEN